MNITVEKLFPRPTQQFPYTCRVDLSRCTLKEYDSVLTWTVERAIPCMWTGNWAVYLDDHSASLMMLRWV